MKISTILEKIDEKQLFVPAFQREYVWKREDAKQLIDSLIKEYPTGTMLIWETDKPPALKGPHKYNEKQGAVRLLLDGQQRVTTLYMLINGEIPPYYTPAEIVEASNVVKTARTLTATRLEAIRDRAAVDLLRSRDSVRQEFGDMVIPARRVIPDAKQTSRALVLEVTGQGPQKTLGRGFAIVRDGQGQPITSAAGAKPGAGMEIEFRDGRLAAQAK